MAITTRPDRPRCLGPCSGWRPVGVLASA